MRYLHALICVFIITYCTTEQSYAQTNTLNETFIGQWQAEEANVNLVFFKDRNNELKMVAWDTSDGEEFIVEKIEVRGDEIETTEKMLSSNWTTYNVYSIVNDNKLENKIGGDGDGVVIYFTRVK